MRKVLAVDQSACLLRLSIGFALNRAYESERDWKEKRKRERANQKKKDAFKIAASNVQSRKLIAIITFINTTHKARYFMGYNIALAL